MRVIREFSRLSRFALPAVRFRNPERLNKQLEGDRDRWNSSLVLRVLDIPGDCVPDKLLRN